MPARWLIEASHRPDLLKADRRKAGGIKPGTWALKRLPVAPGPFVHIRASRDGTQLAVGRDDGRDASVLIYALAGTSVLRRLTLIGQNCFPIWSPMVYAWRFNRIARETSASS